MVLKDKVAVITEAVAQLLRPSPGHSRGKVQECFLAGRNLSNVDAVVEHGDAGRLASLDPL
jgi:hypothetical protein